MDFIKLVQSKKFLIIIVLLAALAVLFLAFRVGISVGYRKARFSYQWGENYDKNFGGPRHGVFGFFNDKGYMNAHGTSGQIIKVDPLTGSGQEATLIIKGKDNMEKTVLVLGSTLIRRRYDTVKVEDLKVDDSVVVIGSSNDQGQIEAKFIRLMPVLAETSSSSFLPHMFRR